MLILGANGKVAGMVRASWAARSDAPVVTPVARKAAKGLVAWVPDAPMDVLPNADVVVALWGVTPGPGARLGVNTNLALSAMRVAQSVGADRVLHCSSAAVYGPAERMLVEGDSCDPASPYGAAKVTMEQALAVFAARHPEGPRPVALRIGNVAGADSLFASLRRMGAITLDRFPDGAGPLRSYIAPGDLARVIESLAAAPLNDLSSVYNVSAPKPTGMDAIAKAAGREVIWRDVPANPMQNVVLDTTRLAALCPLAVACATPEHLVADVQKWGDRT